MARTLSTFTLAMMIPAGIFGLSALMMPAEFGLSSVFFYVISAALFFIPMSFVAARFGIKWPGTEGGIYLWLSESFDARWGLWAVWLQWIQQLVWYPTILSFTASTFARVFFPNLLHKDWFIALFCVGLFWILTFINLRGIEFSARATVMTFLVGVLFPAIVLIVFAFDWQLTGHHTLLHFSWAGLLPKKQQVMNIGLFNGVISGFTGVELCAAYAHRVKNPEKAYPKAIWIAAFITLAIFILGTLAVVMMLPTKHMELTTAIITTIQMTLLHFHLPWLSDILGVLIVFGSFAIVLIWILAPMLSFYTSAKHHDLPKIFAKTNQNGVPINLLILQAIIVSTVSLTFYFSDNVNTAFWLLSALSAQVYFIMYFLLFLGALSLKRTRWLMICIVLGILACILSIVAPFFPPRDVLKNTRTLYYELYLALGLLFICALPLWYIFRRKNSV